MSFNLEDNVLNSLVPGPGKKFKINAFLLPFAIISIYSMIVPIIFLDLAISIYQLVYFSVMGIPKIKKNEYVRLERWDLNKLNIWQKINCVYCEYANGMLAYAKAVGNQTEIFSCAIRHQHALKEHEFEKNYYSQQKFN